MHASVHRVAFYVALSLLSGCGGGGAGTSAIPLANPTAPAKVAAHPPSASASISIRVDPTSAASAAARHPEFVAPTTKSIVYTVAFVNGVAATGASSAEQDIVAGANGCTTNGATITCTTQLNVPIGSVALGVKTYDQTGGTGKLLGSGTATAVILQNVANSLTLTVNGVIAQVQLSSFQTQFTSNQSTLTRLFVVPLDANGNQIVGPGNYDQPVVLSTLGGGGHFTFSLNGGNPSSTVSLVSSSDVVNIFYDGTPGIGSATIAANVAEATPVTANLAVGVTTPALSAAVSGFSPATQSIAISLTPTAGGTAQTFNQNLTTANPKCTQTITGPLTCTLGIGVGVGSYTAAFATYDGVLDSTGKPQGNVLSANSGIPITVTASGPNTLGVVLYGVPTSVVLVPAGSSDLSGSTTKGFTLTACTVAQTVSVLGVDADNDVILGAGAPAVTLTSSSAFTVTAPTTGSPNTFVLTAGTNPTGSTSLAIAATPATGSGATAIAATVPVTFACAAHALSGIVTTLAGSGARSYADGTATAAAFFLPQGVAVDASGNVYVADTYNSRIRKITPTGVVSTLAGSGSYSYADGTGTAASFNHPTGVAVDAGGNVYVADTYNNLIRKITPTGVVSTLAGDGSNNYTNGTGTAASFYEPTGVAVDGSGNLYVADQYNNAIRKITPAGVVSTLAGGGYGYQGYADGTGTAALFSTPTGVAVDGSGNVYVADSDYSVIRKITPTGVVSTLAGNGTFGYADGTGTAASFGTPNGVAVDPSGNVYVADTHNNRIRKITPAGVVSTLAGDGSNTGTNGTGTAASFDLPYGIAIDTSGNLYVADTSDDVIRKIQ